MPKDVCLPGTRICLGRFSFLLISILLMFVLRPFLEGYIGISLLMDIFFTFVLLSAVYALSEKKHSLVIALLISSPFFAARWSRYFVTIPTQDLISSIFGTFFFAYVLAIILVHIFREKEVTGDLIMGAGCGYFLAGMMWAFIYSLVEQVQTGSFLLQQEQGGHLSDFVYFSFVSLTTLGYGDITPLSSPARSLALLEALMGQLYLAVLVARLVGMHISRSQSKSSP